MAKYDIPKQPMRRLRYFTNQFLTETDFIDDQAANLSRERAHLRALCAPGVLEGMALAFVNATAAPTVSAGIAVDKDGRLIALAATTTNGPSPAGLDGDYFIHVTFNEMTSDATGATGDTRFQSQPTFAATRKTQALPDGAVVLGSFTVTSGNIGANSVTAVGRQNAGLRLPTPPLPSPPPNPLPPPPAVLAYRNDGSFDGAQLSGTLTVQKTVAGTIGPTLTLTNANPGPTGAGSSAGAAIDFNAYDPGTNAPTARIQSIGDGTGSSALSFLTKAPSGIGNSLNERLKITAAGAVQVISSLSAPSITGAVNFTGAVTGSSLQISSPSDTNPLTPPTAHGDYQGRIRSTVDHNGYRMGQVSEVDEHWLATTTTVKLPLAAAFVIAGTPGITSARLNFTASGQEVIVPIVGVPAGALITSIVALYNRNSNGDVLTFNVELGVQDNLTATPALFQTQVPSTEALGANNKQLLPTTGSLRAVLPIETTPSATRAGAPQVRINAGTVGSTIGVFDIQVTYVTPGPGWLATYATFGHVNGVADVSGDRIAVIDPDAGINQRSLQLISGPAQNNNPGRTEVFGPYEAFFDTNCIYVMEFMLRSGTILATSNINLFRFGVQITDSSNNTSFVGLQNTTGNPGFDLGVPGAVFNFSTTNVANTTYRVRLELAGASVNSTSGARARLFINGTKGELALGAAITGKLRPYFTVASTTTGGPFDYRIGRLRRVWNHLLTSDNV